MPACQAEMKCGIVYECLSNLFRRQQFPLNRSPRREIWALEIRLSNRPHLDWAQQAVYRLADDSHVFP